MVVFSYNFEEGDKTDLEPRMCGVGLGDGDLQLIFTELHTYDTSTLGVRDYIVPVTAASRFLY
jgi:hypothetical protein